MDALTPARERRALQIAMAVGCLVPLSAGLLGAALGPAFTNDGTGLATDSHYRYLSGLLLGISLGFASAIPRIEARGARVRLLAAIVVIGGLARLLGLLLDGVPPAPMLGGLAMELVVTPALCLWQARVARRYAEDDA